jgi:hypothetical protein
MRKILLAGVTGLVLAGSTAVYAQPWSWSHHGQSRMSMEDRTAFADAKIAAVKAGLKLTADQDRLWPPVEAAVRDLVKLRMERANARMKARQDADRDAKPVDPVVRLRDRAETMAATAAAMKKVADAADPLYKTLDDGQKRRLAVLTHQEGRFGRGHGHHGGFFDRDDDRGRGWRHGSDDGSDRVGPRDGGGGRL